MKLSTILFFFVASNSFASNWVKAPGGVLESPVTVYASNCGEECICIDCDGPPLDVEVCDMKDVEVDDPNFPQWSKHEVEACKDKNACESLLVDKKCLDAGEGAVWREIGDGAFEAYCTKFLGFKKKIVKQLQENPTKKAAKEAAKVAAEDKKKEVLKVLKSEIKTVEDAEAFRRALLEQLGYGE